MVNDKVDRTVAWWQPMLFAALAGGMGWGIRGQYGHESGAMVPGLLLCLTLVFIMCPRLTSRQAARAVALGAIAMGIGGTMTYGQTIGLTQNPPLIGNAEAWRWGMLGLAIKGGIWIGFAGAFLGIGLGGKRYRALEMLWCMLALIGAFYIGKALLNSPFDPANRALPPIYFSASWYWQPEATVEELKPRPEYWGGLLASLVALLIYTRFWRNDALSFRLGLWGILGGAIGFPLGQSLQSAHAWNPECYKSGIWLRLDPHMNWWNMMETTFGATMGAILALGLWLNRERIQPAEDPEAIKKSMPALLAWVILIIHLTLVVVSDQTDMPVLNEVYEMGIVLVALPIVAIWGAWFWPYFAVFPVILLPIAAKTVRELVYQSKHIGAGAGWLLYLVLPMTLAVWAAVWSATKAKKGQGGREFTRCALLFCTWTYFLLNWAFFNFPWPWAQWTSRTPNGIIFTLCAIGLTALALAKGGVGRQKEESRSPNNS